MPYKRKSPHRSGQDNLWAPQYLCPEEIACSQPRFGPADLLPPCKCPKPNCRVVEEVSPEHRGERCCEIPAASTRLTQAAVCLLLRSEESEEEEPARVWLQESL